MRRGVRLAVDAGAVRVGIAMSDADGVLAVPLETVARQGGGMERIHALAAERDAIEVVVGLPVSLSGREGPAAAAARAFARELAGALAPVPVRLVDERLTTVSAERALRERGVRGMSRRQIVDAVAAAGILQSALDAERATGREPGEVVAAGAAP